MSRPTTSQIIEKGDYLKPDFDPASLTIPHLIGILAYHQIAYPSPHTKAKLVDVFNKDIKPNGTRLRQAQLARQATLASDDGIVDGITGIPIAPPPAKPAPTRRYSRRLSREPAQEPPPEPLRPDPPKRRRSSAQPSLGRPNNKKFVGPPPVSEESEEDELPEPEPPKKVGKRKDSETAGSSSRRVSQKFGPGTDDSGWEDNNVFQSGAESSSPVRPPRAKTPRKVSGPRKSRLSMSAPPEIDSSPTRSLPKSRLFSPPQTKFEPRLPQSVTQSSSRGFQIKAEPLDDFYEEDSRLADVSGEVIEEADEEEEQDDDGMFFEDTQTVEVAERIAKGGSDAVVRKVDIKSNPPAKSPLWMRLLLSLFAVALSGVVGQYKLEAAPIGFCDTGKSTNAVLLEEINKRKEIEGCHAQWTGEGNPDHCSPLPLIPLPHPEHCTPCPAHAKCKGLNVQCDEGYILSPHVLSLIPYVSDVANGLPGFGPIAFPPKCVIDETRKRNIGTLGKRIDATLAVERGSRLCAGIDTTRDIDGGDARRWGYEVGYLKELLRKKYTREGDKTIEEFDRLFGEAVDQLMKYGRLIQNFDSAGDMYLASDHEDMSWSCQLTVSARQSWVDWRKSVFGVIGMILLGLYGKAQLAVRGAENQRVSELVQIALDTLRNQEMAHHTDPVTTPHNYLSSVQLRDLVMQDEHSASIRRRLWDRVERIVEGNANVRANLEELPGGEEGRVWRWVGSSGLLSPTSTRTSYIPTSPSKDQVPGSPSVRRQGRIVA